MRTFIDAKTMAKSLRDQLAGRQVALTHAECLEIVTRQFGEADWNVLAAKIAAANGTKGPRLTKTVPVLRIFDVAKAREFYVDFLGFATDWEHRFHDNAPLYTQISRPDVVLHLTEHHGDASPGSTVFVEMHGIEEYHRELLAKNYRYYRPGLEDAPWNARTMEVGDPFGNKLRFNESKAP